MEIGPQLVWRQAGSVTIAAMSAAIRREFGAVSRARALAIFAAFGAGLGLGCADRRAGSDDELELELMPVCVTVWGDGYWDDGDQQPLINEHDTTATVCMCMSWDEQQEIRWGEMELFIEHELNAMAYEECKRISALYEFDSDDCLFNYETGDWRPSFAFAIDEEVHRNQQGLSCEEGDQGNELGCALGGRRSPSAWILGLAGVFGLWRRRRLAHSM